MKKKWIDPELSVLDIFGGAVLATYENGLYRPS
jgi:hypothetical protein